MMNPHLITRLAAVSGVLKNPLGTELCGTISASG